jgi:ATP-dependent RNA helicase DDX19/DBP5
MVYNTDIKKKKKCNLHYINFIVEKGSKIEEQIIVGTPGKVLDWATKYKFFDPKNIKVFVLDEADIMVDTQGHQDQSFRIRK